MKGYVFTSADIKLFEEHLILNEKSPITVEKYLRDVRRFMEYAEGGNIEKTVVLFYKGELEREYSLTSANSMLASLNAFFKFMGWPELCVKQFKIQKKTYCSEDKELTKWEYQSLVKTAENRKNRRLSLLIQTICATGIRVSEVEFITVEAAKRKEAVVSCKGKTRTVFIVSSLADKLLKYAKKHEISSGAIFVTKSGKPMNRSNIWSEMKSLCREAGVCPEKVFPHNLRHLFARTFYKIEKDIAKLADILGHTSINTTRIYIISTGAEHRRKMENMRLII